MLTLRTAKKPVVYLITPVRKFAPPRHPGTRECPLHVFPPHWTSCRSRRMPFVCSASDTYCCRRWSSFVLLLTAAAVKSVRLLPPLNFVFGLLHLALSKIAWTSSCRAAPSDLPDRLFFCLSGLDARLVFDKERNLLLFFDLRASSMRPFRFSGWIF